MMVKLYCLTAIRIALLVIFSVTALHGQDTNRVKVAGKVISGKEENPVPFVHIINAERKKGTASNEDGSFEIKMDKNDTLIFSAIGYQKYHFTLQSDFNEEQVFIKINLDKKTLELEPVTVFAFKNQQEFKRAILNKKDLPEKEEPIKIPGINNGPEKPAKKGFEITGNGVAFVGPFSAIQNMFNNKVQERKKLQKIKKRERERGVIESKYNEKVVREYTGLEGDSLSRFMNFCQVTDRFIKDATEYEILVTIDQCYQEFKNHPGG